MKKTVTFMVLALAISLAGYAQSRNDNSQKSQVHGVKYQPLNMKPGLWEKTFTINTAGAMPLPEEMLNKLTPEQRARIEERMKANSGAHSRTSTDKSCMTKEDLEKPFNPGNVECNWTILESSSTKARGTVSCEAQGMRLNGSGEFEAPDPEHLKGSMHTTAAGGGHNMVVDSTFTGKWLGSNCGDLKH